jgi:hypothetical protein
MPELNRAIVPNNQILLSDNHLRLYNEVTAFFKGNKIFFDNKVTFGNEEVAFLTE